jgi:putative peptide zinc metalloprotease protein
VEPGDYVEQGTPLAKLENLDVLISLAELDGQYKSTETRLDTLKRTVHASMLARGELERVQEDSQSLADQLVEKEQEKEKLTIVAPVSGTVLPPKSMRPQEQNTGQLPKWSGSPLDDANVGAFLDQSVKLCEIGDPNRLEANLIVTQEDIEFVISSVGEGRTVELMFEQRPGKTYTSKIEEISLIELQATPEGLSNKTGGEIPTVTDESGRERPMTVSYEATVPLPEAVRGLRLGSSGIAKIHTRPQTLGQRFWRYLTRTFNFRL